MFVYCLLDSASPYNFEHLNNEGSIQNHKADSKQEEQMPRSQSVALQSKLWGISGIPPKPPPKQQKQTWNVILSK